MPEVPEYRPDKREKIAWLSFGTGVIEKFQDKKHPGSPQPRAD